MRSSTKVITRWLQLVVALMVGCNSTSDFGIIPMAVCDLDDNVAKDAVTDLLTSKGIDFRAEAFGEDTEFPVFYIYVPNADATTAANLVAAHAEENGYKVTVHFGDDTPSRWINHEELADPE